MPQKNTSDPNEELLKPQQLTALEALLAGGTVSEAAEAARVSRETLHRWKRDDWAFQAALNRAQRDLMQAIRGRLLAAAKTAASNVSSAVEDGDLKASLTLLKGLGALSGRIRAIGSDDPEVIEEEAFIVAETGKLMRKLRTPISARDVGGGITT